MTDSAAPGERIARLASNAGLSQQALADATGLSQPTISRILGGRREAKASELLALSRALAVPYAELIEEPPLGERIRVAARTAHSADVDTSVVRDRLVTYLRMETYLDALEADGEVCEW